MRDLWGGLDWTFWRFIVQNYELPVVNVMKYRFKNVWSTFDMIPILGLLSSDLWHSIRNLAEALFGDSPSAWASSTAFLAAAAFAAKSWACFWVSSLQAATWWTSGYQKDPSGFFQKEKPLKTKKKTEKTKKKELKTVGLNRWFTSASSPRELGALPPWPLRPPSWRSKPHRGLVPLQPERETRERLGQGELALHSSLQKKNLTIANF